MVGDMPFSSTISIHIEECHVLTISAGYSDYQVYLLLSCAPVQGHVAGLVDVS